MELLIVGLGTLVAFLKTNRSSLRMGLLIIGCSKSQEVLIEQGSKFQTCTVEGCSKFQEVLMFVFKIRFVFKM